MHERYAERFLCPVCGATLHLSVFAAESRWLVDGLFMCKQNHPVYPLLGGIPRFLTPDALAALVDRDRLDSRPP